MPKTRRNFLTTTSLGLIGAAMSTNGSAQSVPATPPGAGKPTTPGAPPAFGTAPAVGPEVSPATFADAERLVAVTLTEAERAEAAGNWRSAMAPVYERRTGPKRVAIDASIAPYSRCEAVLPGAMAGPASDVFTRSTTDAGPLPEKDEYIAFADVWQQARWIEGRKLTSERLTRIYLERIKRFDPKLHCVITLMEEQALKQAQAADKEIAAGSYRGPLHGIVWGAKDLLDTAGVHTTYGAEPFRDRIPKADATVVERLNAAGAVLIAKLSLGALALNDVWFGGQTLNPWLLEEGSSGSSAGPGAATAAGLVSFAIGSETGGSIVSPTMRCGLTGLRPTFGRIPRTGAMTLCWSLDKLGPMTRSVEDTMLVLKAITGPDGHDVSAVPSKLNFTAGAAVKGLKIGYIARWMQEPPATVVDRMALQSAAKLGMHPIAVELPDWPYGSLNVILFAESAAAFEEITLNHDIDKLKMQTPDAWPNTFRQSRFLSAVDLVQADRLRRKVAMEMERIFSEVDVLITPSLRDDILNITNATGHPSLTLRAGFVEVSEARSDWAPDPARPLAKFSPARRVPHGVTVIGRLFEEGLLAEVGMALEAAFNVAAERPAGFGA